MIDVTCFLLSYVSIKPRNFCKYRQNPVRRMYARKRYTLKRPLAKIGEQKKTGHVIVWYLSNEKSTQSSISSSISRKQKNIPHSRPPKTFFFIFTFIFTKSYSHNFLCVRLKAHRQCANYDNSVRFIKHWRFK